MTLLVTGAAGFIGSFVVRALLARGEDVVGVDNLNDYYTPALKHARLQETGNHKNFKFTQLDIADRSALENALKDTSLNSIIHLAAQAGVRYSLVNPFAYTHSNITGHLSVLELARQREVSHLVYASSSSVYGANKEIPFNEEHKADHPVSLYGATKKSNELMSESYARLYNIPQTGLRFFTVYGPMGRPDMAYWIFTEKMLKGEAIDVYNHGRMARDFTYIDDIVDGILSAHDHPPQEDHAFHRIYNLGNDKPEDLGEMIAILEREFEVTAQKKFLGMQNGDVERTWADISKARAELSYNPKISLAEGLARYAAWRRALPRAFA